MFPFMQMTLRLKMQRLGFDPSSISVIYFLVEERALGEVFLRVLRVSSVSIIPIVPHTHLHLRLASMTNGRSRRTFQKKAVLFRKLGIIGWKIAVILRSGRMKVYFSQMFIFDDAVNRQLRWLKTNNRWKTDTQMDIKSKSLIKKNAKLVDYITCIMLFILGLVVA